ncbi:MAG: DUF45 domain-containing protein [Bacilli bacterium]|nr:DUF45 domain-containing protein [Bacilli bacterium]
MKYSVENNIILNNKNYIYIIHPKKIKHIYFRVKEDLKIHISAPYLVGVKKIEKLLKENSLEIEKMYEKINVNINNLVYLGEILEFIYDKELLKIENNYIYGPSKEKCDAYIYSKAKNYFALRVEQLKKQFTSLPDFELKVRKMTTRWGVCNKKSMTITLNLELIKKDPHLIDYVIIHELCHFKYMDHSKEYWDYVSKYFPYYKKARKELNY